MNIQQIVLVVINVIGGVGVIGSYLYGLGAQAGGANALWGGVPAAVRPLYTISMILSAIGYFLFLYFIIFRLDSTQVSIAGKFSFSLFFAIFLLILLPSALWMPLTNFFVQSPSTGTWVMVRLVLSLVGIGSVALVWALLSLPVREGIGYWLAVGGGVYFAFHTVVLDAIIWAALYK
ncbi:hypothetical protein ACFLW1_02615 [Chloroflexota bacterium]